MSAFQTSLIREKIVIIDADADGDEPISVRSNRILLPLVKDGVLEKIVIRGQNMASTLRMAGILFISFYRGGAFMERQSPYNWEKSWQKVNTDYENEHNPNNWMSIYINGQKVFHTMTSPFVDIVEKCALATPDDYDGTIEFAEYALRELGRNVTMQHYTNVGVVVTDRNKETKCGIIYRQINQNDMIFNVRLSGGDTRTARLVRAFEISAAFVEAINLKYIMMMMERNKVKGSDAKFRDAKWRQAELNRFIINAEQEYKMLYRPERPELFIDSSI